MTLFIITAFCVIFGIALKAGATAGTDTGSGIVGIVVFLVMADVLSRYFLKAMAMLARRNTRQHMARDRF